MVKYDNILVTGCAGFIGAEVTRQLLSTGKKVIGIDNLNDYYDIKVKNHRLDTLKKYNNFIFFNLDIENRVKLVDLFENNEIDAVINLAARAGVRYSMENPSVYVSTNIHGTLNLLDEMVKHDIKKMVLASTSSLYAGQKMPFTEELAVNNPISPYAASKKGAEVMCYSYHHLYKLDISIVRYFTVYGPAGRPDMSVFRFIKWIDEGNPIELFGDGTQSRDFTYIDDIARGTIQALKPLGYEIINLGGGQNPISINEVISKIEKYLDKKAIITNKPFHKADVKSTWADISKANRLLNWAPTISLDKGLENSVEWYNANRSWLSEVQL